MDFNEEVADEFLGFACDIDFTKAKDQAGDVRRRLEQGHGHALGFDKEK